MKLTSRPIYLDIEDIKQLKDLFGDIIKDAPSSCIVTISQSSFADHLYITVRNDGLNIDKEEKI